MDSLSGKSSRIISETSKNSFKVLELNTLADIDKLQICAEKLNKKTRNTSSTFKPNGEQRRTHKEKNIKNDSKLERKLSSIDKVADEYSYLEKYKFKNNNTGSTNKKKVNIPQPTVNRPPIKINKPEINKEPSNPKLNPGFRELLYKTANETQKCGPGPEKKDEKPKKQFLIAKTEEDWTKNFIQIIDTAVTSHKPRSVSKSKKEKVETVQKEKLETSSSSVLAPRIIKSSKIEIEKNQGGNRSKEVLRIKVSEITYEDMESLPIRKKVKQEVTPVNALETAQKTASTQKLSPQKANTSQNMASQKTILDRLDFSQGSNNSTELILRYKYDIGYGRSNTIELYSYDVDKLDPGTCLNDTLINFFLRFIVDELVPIGRRDSIYVFNTYFLEKLKASAKSHSELFEINFESVYDKLSRWTKDVDLFEKEFLIFPHHDKLQMHWSLIVVCNLKYYLVKQERDSAGKPTSSLEGKPFLIYFDSFSGMDLETSKLIAQYLQHELQYKKPELYERLKRNFNGIMESNMIRPILPLQDNYFDCGLFLLQYAEKFLCDPQKIINNLQNDKDRLRWFPKSIIKSKRDQLKKLVQNLRNMNAEATLEYKRETKKIYDSCRGNATEYDEIDSEEYRKFLELKFGAEPSELDKETREKAQLAYVLQRNEKSVLWK